jgi:hypothetical protein
MNMFRPTKAKTVAEYLKALPKERQEILKVLDALIRRSSPKFKPYFAHNMIGYGKFPYLNYKKEKGMWPIVALASQKNYVSIYVCAVEKGHYLAEQYKKKLGKVSVGRSCIRLKKLEDVHLPALRTLLKAAAKRPGLVLS